LQKTRCSVSRCIFLPLFCTDLFCTLSLQLFLLRFSLDISLYITLMLPGCSPEGERDMMRHPLAPGDNMNANCFLFTVRTVRSQRGLTQNIRMKPHNFFYFLLRTVSQHYIQVIE
jgi:hypothetical protein